jgi:hypothetical protein
LKSTPSELPEINQMLATNSTALTKENGRLW